MELLPVPAEPPPRSTTVNKHERQQRRKPTVVEPGSQLRFGPEVPVKEIVIEDPETQAIPEDERDPGITA